MNIPSSVRRRIVESITPYASKLGYTQDQIDDFSLLLDSIQAIIEKADPMAWDAEEVKLVDGKVVLPGNMSDIVQEIVKENQLYTWFIPEKYGGYGLSSLFVNGIMELLNYVDISLSIMVGISLTVLEPLIFSYKDYFKPILDRYASGENIGFVAFTEPEAGSNLENVKTTSYLDGDEYVINGTKIFISNGGYANSGLVLAQNIVDGKQEGHNMFIVENLDGLTCERLEEKSGLHASPTAQLLFKDARVPKDAIVGKVGNGYRGVLERLMSMRIAVSMQAASSMYRAYDLAADYAEQRVQFGKPINSFPGVNRKLEAMKEQIERMRHFSYHASFTLDRFHRGWVPADIGATGKASEEQAASMLPGIVLRGLAHYYASGSKAYTTEISQHVAYDATQIFGGNGFIRENEVNKLYRDVRVLSVYEGTTEIHEWILTRSMQAVQMIPTIKPLTTTFGNSTMYEDMFFIRFPKLKGIV